ncbi:unnamed protein product, partial [Iphiclides podalirius]
MVGGGGVVVAVAVAPRRRRADRSPRASARVDIVRAALRSSAYLCVDSLSAISASARILRIPHAFGAINNLDFGLSAIDCIMMTLLLSRW